MKKTVWRKLSLLVIAAMLFQTPLTASAQQEPETEIQPRIMYIRTLVGYDPDYTTVNYTYARMGQVTLDNRSNKKGEVTLTYKHTSSGTVEASISGHTKFSAEADVVFAKCSSETGISVGVSCSWTAGVETGVSMQVAPGYFGKIIGYCPGVTTEGGLVYDVYNLDYPNSPHWHETVELGTSYVPATNYVHYVTDQRPYQF